MDKNGEPDAETIRQLTEVLHRHFPEAAKYPIDHAWCGTIAVPRDWCATVGLDRAVELISQKREKDAKAKVPIRSFPEEPGLAVLNGRYGPYIAFDGKNYRIPKGYVPEELTLEQCREIMAKSKKK